MTERKLSHHSLRFEMTNELHARPFMALGAPGRVLMLAFTPEEGAERRDPEADRKHLVSFLARHGGLEPTPHSNQFDADLGRFQVKWERHAEFVSYILSEEAPSEVLFDRKLAQVFPQSWLDEAPGRVVAAIEIEVIRAESAEAAEALMSEGPLVRAFSRESLATARTLDGSALSVGDFRIHEGGFSRFAIIVHGNAGPRRIGRAVQRLIEIECYRSLAMLALPVARDAAPVLKEIDAALGSLTEIAMGEHSNGTEQAILDKLTDLSAQIEALSASTAFRFAATRAYDSIVHERIAMMREQRLIGRQLFAEFMLRRFDPAMRTCQAVEQRIEDLSTRANRIAALLRTRVDVALEAQNQKLLMSMDKRAALQLRLQETVEGFSVVAISYYAVNLVGFALYPLNVTQGLGLSKDGLTALVTLPTVVIVALFLRRIRRRVSESGT
ncbi:MAG: DUF3422 domain-containing protein [Pseudomonadota bacterium]